MGAISSPKKPRDKPSRVRTLPRMATTPEAVTDAEGRTNVVYHVSKWIDTGRGASYDLAHTAKDFRLTFAFFSPRVRVPNARTAAPTGSRLWRSSYGPDEAAKGSARLPGVVRDQARLRAQL